MNDFAIDDDGDLKVANGDLVVSESTRQHQKSIIIAGKGFVKHAPTLGVGLYKYLNDHGSTARLASSIRQECERDGMIVESVVVRAGTVIINAEYPS